MSADHPHVRMLAAFDTRVSELCLWLSDRWRDGAQSGATERTTTPMPPSAPGGHRMHAQALSAQMARRIWFAEPVSFAVFMVPCNRIALVGPPLLRRVLAARRLYACRDAARRCIDRRVRRALIDTVGEAAFAAIVDLPVGRAGADDTLPDHVADLAPDALAREGWARMSADGVCAQATLRNMVELSLLAMADTPWADCRPIVSALATQAGAPVPTPIVGPVRASVDDTAAFFSEVVRMFPELQWLFG
ncbi:type III secretion protein HrpB4 [Trinickia caryophylli]|uniref:Type III secretion protein (HrpB4) n=1 Tax=Trinickia caryophylli TaxID=28094 RepID=A0A1X7D723_TRICW|nr:type III secretion protein HrpB4 [Trinickia caryophylli]PMS12689.1 hypothetical protein C0Z17_07590 [Trinickia caryophylli]TRX15095.1 hypothetical protein FNF07_28265 [Trinickia caryophylli]WQE14954.1 type III secretion protein HrpB4 [Trinickia caryophylli]SMF09568.1 type III secretion protein (HrpB4) [Trinickia caryophylli]GLU31317.1 hypothetical protein Busp01_11590 [Trinickia caryophylli]